MHVGKLIVCFILFLLPLQHSAAQSKDSVACHTLPGIPFVFVSDGYSENPPQISDSLFDAAARGIRFKVNRTEIQPSDPFLALWAEVLPWFRSQDMQLGQVYIKGAASPEGPYQNNVRLSRGRTRRLVEFICEGLGQSVEELPISASSVTEDYGRLVKLMQEADDPDYERVNAIWISCQGDEPACKRQLMALDGGKVWRRLLKVYFPSLREARVVLWFVRKKESTKPQYNPVPVRTIERFLAVPSYSLIPPVYTPELERRHLLAVRTNLLHDFLYVPKFGFAPGINVQLEYYPLGGHYTVNAGFTFTNHRKWDQYKFFQVRDLQLELRRYFKGNGAFIGPYLGLYAEGTVYGIGFGKTQGWEGEGGGGGLSLGWTWALNRQKSLRLEVSASLGVFYTRYDPYVYGNPITGTEDGLYYYDYHGNTSDFRERNHQSFWFGPTNLGVHLTYDIIYRKWRPKGYYNKPVQTKKAGGER